MICEHYSPEAWTRVYTHGFVTNVIQNGGAGIVIYFPNGSTDTAIEATRRLYSNYIDESDALMKAIYLLLWTQNQKDIMAVFLTTALSVLQALSP